MKKNRFTDCGKWTQKWFRELNATTKLIWFYLCDNVDDAGVWEPDMALTSFVTGVDEKDISNALIELGDRVMELPHGKYLLPKFISYQYPSGIREDYNPHRPAIRSMQKHGLYWDGERTVFSRVEKVAIKAQPRLAESLNGKDKGQGKGTGRKRLRTAKAGRVAAWWNKLCPSLPNIIKLTDARREALYSRVKEDGYFKIYRVFQKVEASDFLTGRSTTFNASFDWVLKPANFLKIMEKNYQNKNVTQGRFDYDGDF